jgi:1,4-dihydroxy-2-naphthoate octaprenyltransferase
MNRLKYILGPMRLPFVLLPLVCVTLGVAVSIWTHGQVNVFYVVLALIGAVASHISVNVFNEYFDYKTGLDAKTHKTPFSGGSGTLQAHPEMARNALFSALITFTITGLIGLYFLSVRGWALLPVGLLGLVIVYTYTPWITRYPFLCLLAPGLGFGTLWVLGTSFVLTGEYSWPAFLASLAPFFLVNDLLLLNQFPDVEADQSTGRRNYPIVIGRKASSYIYSVFLLLTYLSIVIGVVLNYLPVTSLIGLLTLLLAIPAIVGAVRHANDIPKLIPSLGLNVILNLATPLLTAIGLFLGKR